jgi:F420-0:gamma-glutamyl ligase
LQVTSIKSQKFIGGEDLLQVFLNTKVCLKDTDVLCISSKVVALSQNRIVNIDDYGKDEKEAMKNLIQKEAEKVYPGKYDFTLKDGILIPFAGIDASNVPQGKLVLWPENSYKFAKDFHKKLCNHFKIKNLGILITDSRCQPLRWGVVGLALAWYGFEGVKDGRGKKDLFERRMEYTQIAMADNLASAAILEMGEGSECTPFALIQNSPVSFSIKDDFLEKSYVDPEEDIFQGVMRI